LKNDFKPVYQGINRLHGDLSIALEVDTHPLINADLEATKAVFRQATLEALLQVAQKYNLPTDELDRYRQHMG
jgi:hypothetical protein